MHMAIGAVVNAAVGPRGQARRQAAVAAARRHVSPEELVDARRLPLPHRRAHARRGAGDPPRAPSPAGPSAPRGSSRSGYPAYTTTPGWLGYSDEKLERLVPRGGRRRLHADQAQGRRRPRRRRPPAAASPARPSGRTSASRSTPTSAGTSPRRSRGSSALAPVRARAGSRSRPAPTTSSATPRSRGGVAPDRASRPASTCRTASCSSSCCRPSAHRRLQIDAARVGGVNENIAILLLAAKFGVPVCPHAGGVGLCELVQHLVDVRLRRRVAARWTGA